MLDLIRKINLENRNVPKTSNQNSLAFNKTFIAYTNDELTINLLDYSDKFNKVFLIFMLHLYLK